LLLLTDRRLISKEQVGPLVVCFGQAFLTQFGIHGGLQLLLGKLVQLLASRDLDPLISVEFREVLCSGEVVTNILRQAAHRNQRERQTYATKPHIADLFSFNVKYFSASRCRIAVSRPQMQFFRR
jgi:hypothetical protein